MKLVDKQSLNVSTCDNILLNFVQCKVPGVMHDKMNFWIDKQSVANDRTAGVSIVTELYVTHVRKSKGYLAIM